MVGRHENEKKIGSDFPGPGKYSPSSKYVEVAVTNPISFGSKTESTEVKQGLASKVTVPGPGNYNVTPQTMTKKAAVFGTEQRPGVELKAAVKNPGPGAYTSSQLPGKKSVHNITYKRI